MTPCSCFVEQFRLDRLMPDHPHFPRLNLNDTGPLTEVTPVPSISAAFMLMPRAAYDRVGGMDEDYFLHVETVAMCMRIHKSDAAIPDVPVAAVTRLQGTRRVFPSFVAGPMSPRIKKTYT